MYVSTCGMTYDILIHPVYCQPQSFTYLHDIYLLLIIQAKAI